MISYILLLLAAAFISYFLGSMSTQAIASVFVFKRNIMRMGRGNLWLSNFMRVYGIGGFLLLLVVELIRDALAVGIGMLLLSIKGHPEAGAAFAGFCLVMGRLWPIFYNLRGSTAVICAIVAGLFTNMPVGAVTAVVAVVTLAVWRYMDLTAVASAAAMIVVSLIVINDDTVMTVAVLTGAAILLRHVGRIKKILLGQTEKLSFRQDLSYKFDEKL